MEFVNVVFFFFNDTATTEIYTLSLHDALPICSGASAAGIRSRAKKDGACRRAGPPRSSQPARGLVRGPARSRSRDRKSTRLNSSHANISYAVFCLKKKNYIPLSIHLSSASLFY